MYKKIFNRGNPALLFIVNFTNQWRFIIFGILTLFLIISCDSSSDSDLQVNRKVPQNLLAKAGARSVDLNWSGVAGADGYTLYWSNNPNVSRTNSAAIPTTKPLYQHLALNNQTTYYYRISSHSNGIESRLSNEVTARPVEAAPAKPADLRLKAEDGRISIDYDRVAGVIRYQVIWQAGSVSSLANSPNHIDLLTTRFIHTNLTNGQSYSYLLRVTNASGMSTDSDITVAIPQENLPLAPVITAASASSGQVTLTWSDVSNAQRFDLYWSNSSDVNTDSAVVNQVNSPFTHAPLNTASNQHYYYRLQASNSSGVSTLSNEAHVITPDGATIITAGAAPAIPSSGDGNPLVRFAVDDSQLTLSWNDVDASQALGYNLYWLRGSAILDNSIVLDKSNNSGVIRNIQSAYTHIGLQNNVYYYYRLSAINNAGESDLSTTTFAQRPETIAPGVPSGVTVLVSDQSLSVRWNAVNQADSYTLTVEDTRASKVVVTPNVTSPHLITGLNNGSEYKISMQSVTTTRPSASSVKVLATPQVATPFAPTNLVAAAGDKNIQLRWDAAATPTAIVPSQAQVKVYKVYRATHAGVSPSNGDLLAITPVTGVADNTWQVNVPNLDNARRYYFVITAQNSGGEGPVSNTAWALPQIPIPSAVTRLSASPGDNMVTLYFDPVSNADNNADNSASYNLYWAKNTGQGRSATQVITNISQTPDYVFTDANANGSTYYFKVSASNAGGESVLSAEVRATPQMPAPKEAPGNFSAIPASTQLELSWDSVTNTSEYRIYWSSRNNIDPVTSAVLISSGNRLRHPGLTNGQRYFYRIAASTPGGEGPLSEVITAMPQVDPPAMPSTFALVAGDAQVSINWGADPSNTRNPATGYRLYWRLISDSSWAFIQGVQSGYVHRSLGNTLSYEYYLVAQNAGGDAAPTATRQAIPQRPNPAKPFGLRIAAGDQQNSVTWSTQANLIYSLYWSSDTAVDPMDSGQVFNAILPSKVHGSVTPLNNGVSYRYRVVAAYKDDNTKVSVASDIVTATPQAVTAEAPVGLSAQSGDGQNTLTWFAPANAPAGTTYTLYWGSNATTPPATPIANVRAPYVHRTLSNDQAYYYFVKATSNSNQGPASNLATATPRLAIPGKPTGVVATAGNSQNSLSWLAVSAAQRYTIESSLSGAFDDTQTDTVNAPTIQYTDLGLSNGATVFYRLFASNGTQRSLASAIVNATPQALATPSGSAPVISNTNVSPAIVENNRIVTAITVTDPDSSSFTYNVIGPDSALFSITANDLQFMSAPDFEAPQDSGTDNVYNVTIVANDGINNSAPKDFTVTVTDVNDEVPIISNTNLSLSLLESNLSITTITVNDADSTSFTYTLGGLDGALFAMVGDSLQFSTAPVFANPQDNGADNVYNVSVVANDGNNNSAPKDFAVSVTNVIDTAPVITNTNLALSIAENTTAVTVITVTDPDSSTFTYQLSGPDRLLFSMTGNNLGFISAPNFEAPQDSGLDNNYDVSIVASDGINNSTATAFVITINNINEAPVFAAGIATTHQHEVGEPLVGTNMIRDIAATDVDSDVITFSATNLPPGLSINATSAVISGTLLNTATSSPYTVTITASDLTLSASMTIQWSVIATNPTNSTAIISPTSATVAAGTTISFAIQAKNNASANRGFGGDTVDVLITGNNIQTLTATYTNSGLYTASYVPANIGTDNYVININTAPISTSLASKTISMAGPPATTLSSPTGNEIVVGTHNITWTTVDNNPSAVEIRLSNNSGASYDTLLVASSPDTGTYSWDTTTVADSGSYRVQVTPTDADNQLGTPGASITDFTVDNASTPLVILSPIDQSYNLTREAILSGTCDTSFTVSITYDANTSGPTSYRCNNGLITNLRVGLASNDLIPLSTITLTQTNSTTTTTAILTLKTQGIGNWTTIPSTLLYGQSAIWAQDSLLVWGGTNGYTKSVVAGELINPTISGVGTRLSATGAPTSSSSSTFCKWAEATVAGNPRYVLMCRYSASESRVYDKISDTWSVVNPTGHPNDIQKIMGVGQYIAVWEKDTAGNLLGSLYDVVNDTWEPFPTVGAPSNTNCCGAVSANATQLFMWGGFTYQRDATGQYIYTNAGYILDVSTKTWTTLPTINTPSERSAAQSVWDGTSFVVWGGNTGVFTNNVPDGASYNPTTSTWTPLATVGGPIDSRGTMGIVGSEILIIQDANTYIYNSLSNVWSDGGASSAFIGDRRNYSISFADNAVYVLGGSPSGGIGSSSMLKGRLATYTLATKSWSDDGVLETPVIGSNAATSGGNATLTWDPVNSQAILISAGFDRIQAGRYNPTNSTWSPINLTGSLPSSGSYVSSIWVDAKMMTWFSGTGGSGAGRTYDPTLDRWSPWSDIDKHDYPEPIFVWLGSEVFAWSNNSSYKFVTTPGRLYNPVTDAWRAISATNAPLAKLSIFSPAVSIATNKVLLWSGYELARRSPADPTIIIPGAISSSGHIFDSATNSWAPINLTNAPTPRSQYGGVWTGSEYIVYAGVLIDGSSPTSGGKYNPATDTWSTISTEGAPPIKNFPVAVWTGTHALFWGNGVGGLYDPIKDTWTQIRTTGNPGGGWKPLGVWMGNGLMILNGYNSASNTGAIWRP